MFLTRSALWPATFLTGFAHLFWVTGFGSTATASTVYRCCGFDDEVVLDVSVTGWTFHSHVTHVYVCPAAAFAFFSASIRAALAIAQSVSILLMGGVSNGLSIGARLRTRPRCLHLHRASQKSNERGIPRRHPCNRSNRHACRTDPDRDLLAR